ncbi:hypothetical protein JTB14_027512 [Gonioctena quinquepunctata]|nr:hypothetical protein JTB14_027512 [Gonioctena quinquepunctata]
MLLVCKNYFFIVLNSSKRPKNPSKLADEELQQYHERYLDLDGGLSLFENSSDEEDLLEEIDFEPDVIDVAAVEPQDDYYDVADLSLLPAYTSKDGTTWYKRPLHSTKSTKVFSLFLTNTILEIIVEKTNEKAILVYEKWIEKHPENKKVWTPTDSFGMKAYIGLLLSQGALKARKEPVEMLWISDKCYSRPTYPATMSRDRFFALTKCIHFDNMATRAERRAVDKLVPIRCIFDMIVGNFKRMMYPGSHMTIDEQLPGFRDRAPYRVHMKSKPDKYGMKLWALCDAANANTHNLQVYSADKNKAVILLSTEHNTDEISDEDLK